MTYSTYFKLFNKRKKTFNTINVLNEATKSNIKIRYSILDKFEQKKQKEMKNSSANLHKNH